MPTKSLAAWAIFVKLIFGIGHCFMQKMVAMTCGYASYYNADVLLESKQMNNHCRNGMSEFRKAFFLSTIAFISMGFCLPIFVLWRKRRTNPSSYSRRMILLMIIPAVVESVAFCLGAYGNILMALSLTTILTGARVVFSAIFTVIFLDLQLCNFHWFAVILCVAGLLIATGSEYLNDNASIGTILLGTTVMLGSECLKAFRVIFDEKMFKANECDVTFVVGLEGVYGCCLLIPNLLLVWLVFPGNEGGSMENLEDTLYRIHNSTTIWAILCIFTITGAIGSIAGALVTKHLSGIHYALVSVFRSILIWAIELTIFYCASDASASQYGVPWRQYTYLKLVGFVCVIFATLIYNEDIVLAGMFTHQYQADAIDMTDDENQHLITTDTPSPFPEINKQLSLVSSFDHS